MDNLEVDRGILPPCDYTDNAEAARIKEVLATEEKEIFRSQAERCRDCRPQCEEPGFSYKVVESSWPSASYMEVLVSEYAFDLGVAGAWNGTGDLRDGGRVGRDDFGNGTLSQVGDGIGPELDIIANDTLSNGGGRSVAPRSERDATEVPRGARSRRQVDFEKELSLQELKEKLKVNWLKAQVYFDTMDVRKVVEAPKYRNAMALCSSLGGALSLFLGMTVLSIFEVVLLLARLAGYLVSRAGGR